MDASKHPDRSRRFFIVSSGLSLAAALEGCVSLGGRGRVPLQTQPTFARAGELYYDGCICNHETEFKKHNCTHFLSNALIRAGYSELIDSPIFTIRCPKKRPVRAQEMLKWFQAKALRFKQGPLEKNSGIWASYQEKPGGRHVLLIDTDHDRFYGTANCEKWPVQWHYQW